MKFSVLMSVYFKEIPQYLDRSLESIIEQTVVPDEIVLVKDGELTAELDRIIEQYYMKYPKLLKIISLYKNVGLGEALRIGLDNCSYDTVARMDSDDVCLYTRFEKQLEVLKQDEAVKVVGSWISEFESDTENIHAVRKVPESFDDIRKKAKFRNPLNHMTVMFRKSAVIEAGGYKPFLWSEDYYLWVRMILKGFKIVNIQESLVFARAGRDMIKRRGGMKYVVSEAKLEKEFLKLGFINHGEFIFNVATRTAVRIIPDRFRQYVYYNMLRG